MVVFLDGDMSLTFQPERSDSGLLAVDGVRSEELPFRMFEQHLLHYSPAVGFPYYSGWHHDNGEEVPFVSSYDHIVFAIHHNVSRFFCQLKHALMMYHGGTGSESTVFSLRWPSETKRCSSTPLSGKMAAPARNSRSLMASKRMPELRNLRERAVAVPSMLEWLRRARFVRPLFRCVVYVLRNTFADMRDNDFEAPFFWFMSSLLPEVSTSLFFNVSSPINTDLKSPHALRSAKDNLKTDGVCHLAQSVDSLGNVFDVYHPYWMNRKIFFGP
jgi:hypothetical protein